MNQFLAVAASVLVNVESARELPLLAQASQPLGLPGRLAVRVNPDFEVKGAGIQIGGGPKPFGIDVEQVPQVPTHIAAPGLDFEWLHLYAGSQNLQAPSTGEAQLKSHGLALRLAKCAPVVEPLRTSLDLLADQMDLPVALIASRRHG